MKKIISSFVVLSLCMGFVFAQEQVNPMELPKLTQRVTDFSDTLTTSQLDEVNAVAKSYEDVTSNQLFVVLFPHRQGNELIDIGVKAFHDNGIGQADNDNGLLLLISTEEKKIRIVVGYGLEGVYPDLVASQIIENNIRPLVDDGDFYGAIQAFYDKSKEVIAGEYVAKPFDPYAFSSYKIGSEKFNVLIFSIVFMFLFGTIGFFSAKGFYTSKHKKYSKSKQKRMLRWIIGAVTLPFCLAIISLPLFLLNLLGSWTIMLIFIFNFIPFMAGIFGIVKFGNPGGSAMSYTPGKGWRPGSGGGGSSGDWGGSGGGGGGSSSSGGGGGGSSGGGGAGD